MATIKSYTDIEQSNRLAEILSTESADMGYLWNGYNFSEYPVSNQTIFKRIENVPCWSLSALIKIIEIDKSEICFDCYNEKYCVNVHYQTLGSFCQDSELYESKIDACVAMIEKLHKLNLL